MMFLFAYLGSFAQPPGWPIRLIYATEAGFVVVAFACILLAMTLRRAERKSSAIRLQPLGASARFSA
jgi:hypothetical protein